MKLKNKKTGEIGKLHFEPDKKYHFTVVTEDPADMMIFKTLAELNEEWEDYEELKNQEFYYIDTYDCEIQKAGDCNSYCNYCKKLVEFGKQIGNYYDTKEEAEKAVEKLKAWKRLKDNGAEFYGWRRNHTGTYELYLRWKDRIPRSYEVKNDLNLLFGGEE